MQSQRGSTVFATTCTVTTGHVNVVMATGQDVDYGVPHWSWWCSAAEQHCHLVECLHCGTSFSASLIYCGSPQFAVVVFLTRHFTTHNLIVAIHGICMQHHAVAAFNSAVSFSVSGVTTTT